MDFQSQPTNSEYSANSHDRWTDKFERQAALNPDQTAVVSGNRALSYRELSESSNRIANLLRESGIKRGDFVGLGLQRCLELPAALLGILKAGAAYIPLDPSYPSSRIEQMIESAKVGLVVTQQSRSERFANVKILCIDSGVLSEVSKDAPFTERGDDDLIYAIFTSGSTGKPKAASVHHRSFENLLHWYAVELQLGSCDRTLVISSPSFDLTQKNFFTPLITGGTLVLDDCKTYDIARITKLIRDHAVTLINCTPSAFYPLVDAAASGEFQALSSLRFAVLGGEPISVPRLRAWLEHPNCRAEVVNTYGPTECTDICLFHRLHRGNLDEHSFVPLGKEIPNVEVSLRDSSFEIVPDGEIGEICISGAGVGAGYLHDPVRTAEVFIDGSYRTGDLGKRHPSQIIEFRGRADHQVKINGFRIELGEIEIALQQHEGVKEAVVLVNGNRLIAHVQGNSGKDELKEFLSNKIPAYMVPNEYHFVENFPLTPNGKVDRLALQKTEKQVAFAAVTGAGMESQVLQLWSEVLGRTVTDGTANFFDLGGSSIHIAIVHVRLMELTGRQFAITELFALPNARSIAEYLSPQGDMRATRSTAERATLAQASFSRFRRPSSK